MSLLRRLGLAVVAAVTLAACDASVRTTVEVAETATAVTVAVHLTGPAAESLQQDPTAESNVLAAFREVTGSTPEPRRESGSWAAAVTVPADRVAAAAGFTAVASLERSGTGSATTVTAAFTPPARLAAAFDAAVAGRSDAADVRAALGAATVLSVTVYFPGGVSAASTTVGGLPVERDGDRVTLSFSLDEVPAGELLVVTGDPRPARLPSWLTAAAAALAVALGGYLVFGRRHQRGASR